MAGADFQRAATLERNDYLVSITIPSKLHDLGTVDLVLLSGIFSLVFPLSPVPVAPQSIAKFQF